MDDNPAALFPERADAEGRDRQRLDHGGVARHRGAQGHAGRRRRPSSLAALKKVSRLKEFQDFMASRGFGVLWAAAGRVRQVHGQVGRRPRRDDEGRGHRQVTATAACKLARTRAIPMKINDAVLRRAVVVLSLLVLWTHPGLPAMPGQNFGPAAFPGDRRAGWRSAGVLLIVQGLRARARPSAVVRRSAPGCGAAAAVAFFVTVGGLRALRRGVGEARLPPHRHRCRCAALLLRAAACA